MNEGSAASMVNLCPHRKAISWKGPNKHGARGWIEHCEECSPGDERATTEGEAA